jgi:hypothetical protein
MRNLGNTSTRRLFAYGRVDRLLYDLAREHLLGEAGHEDRFEAHPPPTLRESLGRPNRRGEKAEVSSPRRAMGDLVGAGVRFGAASAGVPPIIVAGGMAKPTLPMIAGLSASHLAGLHLPLSLGRLYIALDRDPAAAGANWETRRRAANKLLTKKLWTTISIYTRNWDSNWVAENWHSNWDWRVGRSQFGRRP